MSDGELSVEATLWALVQEGVSLGRLVGAVRRRAGRSPSEVDEAMGWPAGRCEAVEGGEAELEERDEIGRLLRGLGGRPVVEEVLVEVAVEQVRRGLAQTRKLTDALVLYAAWRAVQKHDPQLLLTAVLEFATRVGLEAEARRERGDGIGDDDLFVGGGGRG